MDIQGVVPFPIEDLILLVKTLDWKLFGNKRDSEIKNCIKEYDENENWPKILILMAWYVPDNTEEVVKCLKSIFGDGYPNDRLRIIIIVNGENPPLPIACGNHDIVEQYKKELEDKTSEWRNQIEIITVHNNKGNKAIPLNSGYSFAIEHEKFQDIEYILTTDPDGYIQRNSLKRLIAHFLSDEKEDVAAVGGVITTRKEKKDCKDKKYRCYNRYTKWEFLVSEYSTRWLRCVYTPYLYHISGGLSAFRKKILDEIGKRRGTLEGTLNGKYREIKHVFYEESVTEDYEITQHILDMGKKVEHDPYATYFGGAENNHMDQWKRFRRWYGGSAQVDTYKKNLFCSSTFWSNLSRGWRSFSATKYTYWWVFTLLFLPIAIVGFFYSTDKFFEDIFFNASQSSLRNVADYTLIGGPLSIYDLFFKTNGFYSFITFWLSFPKIFMAEVTLGWFELLFTTILGFRSLNKQFDEKFEDIWKYFGLCFLLPFEIVLWNRIYWFYFSIHGRVTEKKLPW